MTLRQPTMYTGADNRKHFHDSIYFKTITQYNGNTSAALVEYALVDLTRERPKLQKRIWRVTGIDSSTNRVQINDSPTATTPVEQDLCLYVTDVNFQFFVKNKRKGATMAEKFVPGGFYSAQDLVDAKVDPTINAAPFTAMRNFWTGSPGAPFGSADYMVMCYYDPAHAGASDMGQFTKAETGLFHTQQEFDFGMLSPGDRIFIFPSSGSPASGGVQQNDYTIKGWRDFPGNTSKHIEFMEHISTTNPNFPATCEMAYRAGWLPPAVRVTLKIKDAKAREIRTISRTFKVLASS
jgi:hypothetical protein